MNWLTIGGEYVVGVEISTLGKSDICFSFQLAIASYSVLISYATMITLEYHWF